MLQRALSAADKSYFWWGAAFAGYATFDRYYNHSRDTYYFFIGAVLFGLGLFRQPMTAWAKGRLLESEVVRLAIGVTMCGYTVFDWFKYHAVDPVFASIGLAVLGFGVVPAIQRAGQRADSRQDLKEAVAKMQRVTPLPADEIEMIQRKAESGDIGSQRRLAYIFQTGRHGLPKSEEDAYFWYSVAEKSGHTCSSKMSKKMAANLTAEQVGLIDKRVEGWMPTNPAKL